MKKTMLFLFAVLPISGCVEQPSQIVPDPTYVTIGSAIMQVRDGLVAAEQKSVSENQYAGLFPCSASIVFNVTAGANKSSQLVLDASIKPPIPVAPSLGATETLGGTSNASVGNQITVNLTSLACLLISSSNGSNTKPNQTGTAPGAGTQNPPASPTSLTPAQLKAIQDVIAHIMDIQMKNEGQPPPTAH